MMTKSLHLFFLPLILSGCMGIYEGGFECPPGKGVKCKSISEVNEMVNQREIPPKITDISLEEECLTCTPSTHPQNPSYGLENN